jgi:NAD+ diphosphatase
LPLSLQESIQFCVRCGGKLELEPARALSRCSKCGIVQHFNPITAVGVLIHNAAGEVLLIRRNRDPGKGKLGVPGGFIDIGETAEAAASRETREEIGIDIEGFEYIGTFPNQYVYQGVTIPVLDIYFAIMIEDHGTLSIAADEVIEAGRYAITDDTLNEMAFTANRKALEVLRDRLSNS